MTKGNVGSLLVFDPAKITIDAPMKEAAGDAVVGIVTERGEGGLTAPQHGPLCGPFSGRSTA
jgi:hypothetical protein